MKNKNKKLTHNDFEKNFDSTLFESKFVYLQGHHLPDKDWVEPTNVEEGQAAAESIVNEFDRRYNPAEIPNSERNVDSEVFGVRRSLMQGPLNDLNAENILDNRIASRLEYVRRNAPEFYKHVIDEQYRAQNPNPPGAVGTIWNAMTFERWRTENNISREMFSYNLRAGQNYNTLINGPGGIVPQIQGLGPVVVGPLPGVGVNFGNINEVTTFNANVGPGGGATNDQVIVRWFEDDYITIKKKLIRANAWDDLMAVQPQGSQFMLLKFRQSLLEKVINEERAKLSNDRFRPQRLQTFLDNDAMTQALQDQGFQDWVNTNSVGGGPNDLATYADAEALQAGNQQLYDQMLRQQELAKQRVQRNTLEQILRDILTPNQIEQLHKSDEVKAMLAYLQAEINDPEEGNRAREFIRGLAGRLDDIDNLTNDVRTWEKADEAIISLTDFSDKFLELQSLPRRIQGLTTSIEGARAGGGGGSAESITRLADERNKLQEKRTNLEKELINNAWSFIQFVENEFVEANSPIADELGTLVGNTTSTYSLGVGGGNQLLNHRFLQSRPSSEGEKVTFLRAFSSFLNQTSFRNDLDDLTLSVTGQKLRLQDQLNAAKQSEGKAEKMDARGLLYRLVERDLRAKGVTEQNGIQQKALYATNILIAKSRNTDIYGQTNKQVARTIEGSWLGRHFRSDAGNLLPDGVLPVLSAKDILSHLADEPGFEMFSNLNVFSSVADLRRMMARYGMADQKKLRELQEKIGLFISGVEVPKEGEGISSAVRRTREKIADTLHLEDLINRNSKRKPVYGKTYKVRSEEAPLLENMMHQFALLEAEISAKTRLSNIEEEIQDSVERGEEVNRSEVILKNLQEQTSDSRDIDDTVTNSVKSNQAPFRKRLIFNQLRNDFYEVMEDAQDIPDHDEREEFLASKGFPPRVRAKGIFSLRTRWWAKKIGKGAISLPFKVIGGVAGGIKTFGKWAYKKLYGAETWDKSNQATNENWKSIFRAPFTAVGGVLYNYPVKILSFFPKMLDKTAVKSTAKSYAAINRDVVTS
ncbi:hypothetical protein ACFL3T_05020 [Patescibacteria group bacterium]